MLFGAAFAHLLGVPPLSPDYAAFVAAGFAGMLASSMNIPLAAAIIAIESFGLQYSFPAGIAAIIGFQINRHQTIYDYTVRSGP
jgi:H+/Cl- antiporter ClcA